jgi:hypothetical protein
MLQSRYIRLLNEKDEFCLTSWSSAYKKMEKLLYGFTYQSHQTRNRETGPPEIEFECQYYNVLNRELLYGEGYKNYLFIL